jgi:hypothetical protein
MTHKDTDPDDTAAVDFLVITLPRETVKWLRKVNPYVDPSIEAASMLLDIHRDDEAAHSTQH